MPSDFISEPLEPASGTFDVQSMARGEPGLPGRFTWRGREHVVAEVLERWNSSSPEGGSGELYLRRHYFKLRTAAGLVMTVYCERQKNRRNAKSRWWLYTLER